VIDVGVRHHDLFDGQMVFSHQSENVLNVIAWIDDDCFSCGLVPHNRAVALQWADGNDVVNHRSM
jgi:hypothetical protein